MIKPQLLADAVEPDSLRHGVEAVIAEIGTHQEATVLFDEVEALQ
ncbi:MAG: hypothetical protein ACP5R2_03570 [Anaerolineae bacterium]